MILSHFDKDEKLGATCEVRTLNIIYHGRKPQVLGSAKLTKLKRHTTGKAKEI